MTITQYIYGFALQQRDMAPETPEDFAAEAGRQMREYATALADFPHLIEVVGGHIAETGYDYDAEFLFGLALCGRDLDVSAPSPRTGGRPSRASRPAPSGGLVSGT